MTTPRLWILGAPDPEMEAIECLLRTCGEPVAYATVFRDGTRRRVRPAEAYASDVAIGDDIRGLSVRAYAVECRPAVLYGAASDGIDWGRNVVTIDHHTPGDPGYGRPPAEFLPASALGQVIAELARLRILPWPRHRRTDYYLPTGLLKYGVPGAGWEVVLQEYNGPEAGDYYAATVPPALVLCAAADHCLAAAYRGECPDVEPDALMQWRLASRAAFQRRAIADLLADVERGRDMIRTAPTVDLAPGISAVDLRGVHVPELPEASAREGRCVVADGLPEPNGRQKVNCLNGSPAQIRAFLDVWAPHHGLTDCYGDPARGFAGGYLPAA